MTRSTLPFPSQMHTQTREISKTATTPNTTPGQAHTGARYQAFSGRASHPIPVLCFATPASLAVEFVQCDGGLIPLPRRVSFLVRKVRRKRTFRRSSARVLPRCDLAFAQQSKDLGLATRECVRTCSLFRVSALQGHYKPVLSSNFGKYPLYFYQKRKALSTHFPILFLVIAFTCSTR